MGNSNVNEDGSRWALLLAAGEGSRLRGLTTTEDGVSVPKQFCSLRGGPSLLQESLQRAEGITSTERICAIVAAQHNRWWEASLSSLPETNTIVQPANRGTANGILLPLLRILDRDPRARIVLLPCDHHVRDEATLQQALRLALLRLESNPSQIVLLGIEPEEPDPELGYIVPGRQEGDIASVVEFVEKPPVSTARSLIDRGGLWNAFIVAATGKALLRLFQARVPELVTEMRCVLARSSPPKDAYSSLCELYSRLPELDFSRHIVAGQETRLGVFTVPACGWSDLGTPKRVGETLHRIGRSPRATIRSYAQTAHVNLAAQYARLQSLAEATVPHHLNFQY